MKQHKRNAWSPQPSMPAWAANSQSGHIGGRVMNRFWRRFFIILLAVLVAGFLLAGLAAWKPWILTWDTLVVRQSGTSRVDYIVHLKPDAVPGLDQAPADAVYLDELVAAVEPTFTTTLTTDRAVAVSSLTTLSAAIRAHEPGENQPTLFQVSEAVMEPATQSFTNQLSFMSSHAIRFDLDTYRSRAASIAERLEQQLTFELALVYQTDYTLALPGGPAVFSETATLIIPLNEPVYRIERSETISTEVLQPVNQMLRYRIYLELFPWWVFLAAALLSLISLLLLLFTTQSRPRDSFRRNLRRMKRQASGRLIMIGDRAWDPAWCVRVTDYAAMAKTARKLKHPLFCYVDALSAWPVAYFYAYYGENNYCHIYTEHPESLEDALTTAPSAEDETEEDEQDIQFPVLPEDDELPSGGNSPEVKLTRPDRPDVPNDEKPAANQK
ncbi:MAG: DUF5305 family protein [Bacillota bacterium]|nr:DUF5305 family protein [Bacillota bacterium]